MRLFIKHHRPRRAITYVKPRCHTAPALALRAEPLFPEEGAVDHLGCLFSVDEIYGIDVLSCLLPRAGEERHEPSKQTILSKKRGRVSSGVWSKRDYVYACLCLSP
jgi:hypothetical protein